MVASDASSDDWLALAHLIVCRVAAWGVRDPAARARLIVPLRPAPELKANAVAGTFDIVGRHGSGN